MTGPLIQPEEHGAILDWLSQYFWMPVVDRHLAPIFAAVLVVALILLIINGRTFKASGMVTESDGWGTAPTLLSPRVAFSTLGGVLPWIATLLVLCLVTQYKPAATVFLHSQLVQSQPIVDLPASSSSLPGPVLVADGVAHEAIDRAIASAPPGGWSPSSLEHIDALREIVMEAVDEIDLRSIQTAQWPPPRESFTQQNAPVWLVETIETAVVTAIAHRTNVGHIVAECSDRRLPGSGDRALDLVTPSLAADETRITAAVVQMVWRESSSNFRFLELVATRLSSTAQVQLDGTLMLPADVAPDEVDFAISEGAELERLVPAEWDTDPAISDTIDRAVGFTARLELASLAGRTHVTLRAGISGDDERLTRPVQVAIPAEDRRLSIIVATTRPALWEKALDQLLNGMTSNADVLRSFLARSSRSVTGDPPDVAIRINDPLPRPQDIVVDDTVGAGIWVYPATTDVTRLPTTLEDAIALPAVVNVVSATHGGATSIDGMPLRSGRIGVFEQPDSDTVAATLPIYATLHRGNERRGSDAGRTFAHRVEATTADRSLVGTATFLGLDVVEEHMLGSSAEEERAIALWSFLFDAVSQSREFAAITRPPGSTAESPITLIDRASGAAIRADTTRLAQLLVGLAVGLLAMFHLVAVAAMWRR